MDLDLNPLVLVGKWKTTTNHQFKPPRRGKLILIGFHWLWHCFWIPVRNGNPSLAEGFFSFIVVEGKWGFATTNPPNPQITNDREAENSPRWLVSCFTTNPANHQAAHRLAPSRGKLWVQFWVSRSPRALLPTLFGGRETPTKLDNNKNRVPLF